MSGSHKYTWEKDKLTFFTPILEIKTKKLLLNLKGHQSSGAWAPELWCPKILLVVLLTHIRWQSSSYFLVHNNITKTTTTIQHLYNLYIISDGVNGTMAAGHYTSDVLESFVCCTFQKKAALCRKELFAEPISRI